MPLSEEELRLLEQMERALAVEDPKFVSALQGRTLRRVARLRTFFAGAAFLGGIALLMGGAIAELPWLGIIGFLVMGVRRGRNSRGSLGREWGGKWSECG